MVFQLDNDIWFPDPRLADDDGLLAVGGDLSVDRLLVAYSNGIFPWYSFRDTDEIMWYCPHKRFVIFPNEIHISHSMRTLINKKRYRISINKDFEGVIHNCSKLRFHQEGAWLGEDMIEAFTRLHRHGFARSIEVTENCIGGQQLVGGLYGVCVGRVFVGESMFSLRPSTSKLALIALAQFMQARGGILIDCQLHTPHLESMGGRYISYEEYMEIMKLAWGQ